MTLREHLTERFHSSQEADFLIEKLIEELVKDYPRPLFSVGQAVELRGCAEHCRYGKITEVKRKRGREPSYRVDRGVQENTIPPLWGESDVKARS